MEASDFIDINNEFVGTEIVFLNETNSTNDDAKEMGAKGTKSGAVIITRAQLKGKGRLGRGWENARDKDIALSVLLRPDMDASRVQRLTLLAAVCVCNTITKITGIQAGIKWPNDVVINAKKICGILTESSFAGGKVSYGVVGIGINVNSENFSREIAHKATSLMLECGTHYSRAEIIKQLLCEFDESYSKFLECGEASFMEEYRTLCITIGMNVVIHEKNNEYSALAQHVNDSGELIVSDMNGVNHTINSGEVSVRGVYGYV